MSDEEVTVENTDGQILAAEYRDGQLQIVEVTPFDKNDRESNILPDLSDEGHQHKYMELLDSGKNLMQLDLVNLTLVRCSGDDDSYELVANTESSDTAEMSSETVTCVLQASDTEETENPNGSYVMVETPSGEDTLVYLKPSVAGAGVQKTMEVKPPLTPAEILEKAKALQKAKAQLARLGDASGRLAASSGRPAASSGRPATSSGRPRGRKRLSDLPPPHELLASPNFKLYLYSCKHCPYKCNAIKEMWAHKTAEHAGGGRRAGAGRGGGGAGGPASLQCARCPYRGATHSQLMKHVQDKHLDSTINRVHLNTEEVEAADVLVCGACGFESASRPLFRKHIEDEHGATTC